MEYDPLSYPVLFSTILYATLGVVLLLAFIVVFDRLFKLDLHKELVQDQNVAFGIVIAGVAIGISIILAASIV